MTTLASDVRLRTSERGGAPVPHHRVAVIGAGFGGIGTAIKLREVGIDDVVVLERAGDIGGTWRDNTYPGCQCDVPSFLYSFSFAPNPDWSRTFALQPEIQAYLRRVVDERGVRECMRFGHDVLDARWVAGERRWAITTSAGDLTADVLVSAHGGLSTPRVPDIPGLGSFAGTVFHSGAWDHDHDLTGERVGIIGTGASAVQIVPHVQEVASHLTVFQRTPGWVLPHTDRPIPEARRVLYRRLPAAQKAVRGFQYLGREGLVVVLAQRPSLARFLERIGRDHLARQVPDEDLRRKLTPSYTPGCKRLLLSNHYLPALCQPNVDLVTEGISTVRPGGIATSDGAVHELDTIILATGYATTDHPISHVIHGVGGRSLHDAWTAGQRAHLGVSVPGFPNLFVLMGPNTALGHSSIVYMLESQITYLASALAQMDERGIDVLDVTAQSAEAFDREMQARLAGSVWNAGGCRSWYLDPNGRNSTMWPGFTFEYRRRTRRCDLSDYHVLMREPAPAGDGLARVDRARARPRPNTTWTASRSRSSAAG